MELEVACSWKRGFAIAKVREFERVAALEVEDGVRELGRRPTSCEAPGLGVSAVCRLTPTNPGEDARMARTYEELVV